MTTSMKTARKATHTGECQCCGRRQKLPNGRLSLHGYTKQWGFFQGTCYGAEHLPYEQDCTLVKSAAERAATQLTELEQRIADLKKNDNPDDVINEIYVSLGRGRRGYRDQHGKVTCTQQTIDYPNGTTYTFNTYTFEYKDRDEVKHVKMESYRCGSTLAETALKMNAGHASKLERNATQIRQYITWTQKRIAEWQPRELTPISE